MQVAPFQIPTSSQNSGRIRSRSPRDARTRPLSRLSRHDEKSACIDFIALVAADRIRPGTAERLAVLPGITVLELDLSAVLAVARETSWAPAHTRYAAEPNAERPSGAVIATTAPETWRGQSVRVIDLGP